MSRKEVATALGAAGEADLLLSSGDAVALVGSQEHIKDRGKGSLGHVGQGIDHNLVGDAQSYPEVLDDLPTLVPAMQREIDVIETYLGSLMDKILGGCRSN